MNLFNRYAPDHDVVIVGARAAGAATAMLLARQGVRVLAVDRSKYGADTLSTHALMRGGVLQLARWGVLDAIRDAGTPTVRRARFHYAGEEIVPVKIQAGDGVDGLYAPRRTVLDPILVDAAREAGAEIRYGFTVDDVLRNRAGRVVGIEGRDENGEPVAITARVVVGADGMKSRFAQAVGAPTIRTANHNGAVVYGYFAGVEIEGYEWLWGDGRAGGLIPTNDGLVCAFVSTTPERFRSEIRGDLQGAFTRYMEHLSPDMAARLAGGVRVGRLRGFTGVTGYIRRPWGAGWALVGDAGYFKDPITAHGLSDALRDAELLARALVEALTDDQRELRALSAYERVRNELSHDLFEVTEKVARYDWSMEELRSLLRDLSHSMGPEVDYLLDLDEGSVR
jgi:flavin-dependent dehydrogenase